MFRTQHKKKYHKDQTIFYSADGHYEVTLMTKATVYNSGLVVWQPPAVYKSSCSIDVEYFPYDVQTCVLKLGSWTYDGFKVPYQKINFLVLNLIHLKLHFGFPF